MESVEREVVLPVDAEEAWRLVSDAAELATWLGSDVDIEPVAGAAGEVLDSDGTRRRVMVETVDEGRSISWYWWEDDGDDVPSRVEMVLTPGVDGTTLRVLEQPVLPPTSAAAGVTARSSTSSRVGAWSYRLFALEVRCLGVTSAVLARS